MHNHTRPFTEADRAAVVELDNAELPPQRRTTAADWAADDTKRPANNVLLRAVIGDPPVAFLQVEDMATAAPGFRAVPGICELLIVVHRARRCQGLGSALYERALAFARERRAALLCAWVYQRAPDDPGPLFLQRRGFVETARRQTAHLGLADWDAARFAAALTAVERQGIRVVSYAELPGTDEQRRKLHALYVATGFAPPDVAFERWAAARLDHADWSADTCLLAEHAGAWIGLTHTTVANRTTGTARITATATLPAWQGRGIATALKVRGIAALQAQGATAIVTSNRVDNAPILAINRKLGYVPGPLELTLERRLDA